MIALSILVVTSGRDSLTRTLDSIAAQPLAPQDEVLVVGRGDAIRMAAERRGYRYVEDGPFGCWGQRERQAAMALARGTHLLFIDDDDVYTAGAFAAVRRAITAHPDRPILAKMIAPEGHTIWMTPAVVCGQVSGTQFIVPNDPARLGTWGLRREGDYDFIVSTLALYPPDAVVWDSSVIVGCREYGIPAVAGTCLKVLLVHPGASWSTADVEAGLRYGLEYHGVDVVRYQLDERIDRSRRWLYTAWRRARKTNATIEKPTAADVFYQAGIGALERALRHQVDAVVVVSAMLLHPDVIILMKRAGLRVTVLFTETPYDQDKELAIAKLVDGCWTNERSAVPAFRAVNAHAGYLPHGWHPARHRVGEQPGDRAVPAHDVVFVGSAFRERVEWLTAIDWTGVDLGLYGSWENIGAKHPLRRYVRSAAVANPLAAALYRRAKVGLNLYRTSHGWAVDSPAIAHAESLNPRAYELAACGAFHLSTPREEVAEVFGGRVPVFEPSTDPGRLIRSWLGDVDGRARIAQQLPACVAESSWVERSTRVIGDLQSLLQPQAA